MRATDRETPAVHPCHVFHTHTHREGEGEGEGEVEGERERETETETERERDRQRKRVHNMVPTPMQCAEHIGYNLPTLKKK